MTADDLPYLAIADISRLLRERTLSSVELVEALLGRIGSLEGAVRAFVSVDAEGVREQAKAADRALADARDGQPLLGVPLAIKDIVDVAGLPTTAGSRVLAGNVATEDAALVAALRAAGAVILGKTNTHEFAYGVITPPTRNPWDLTRIPGGSSGGSAAALAAGMAPGAVGTDTAGSIRLPAALCGVVGLKPTYGRISRHGVIPLSWSLDHAGPMTRTVEDAALLLDVMMARGADPRDPATSNVPLEPFDVAAAPDVKGLRAGVARAYFFDDLEPAVAGAVAAALDVLVGLGVELRDVALPDAEHSLAIGRAVQRPESSAYHARRLREMPELYGDEIRGDLELGGLILATDYIHAQRLRAIMRERWLAATADLDVVLTPTVPATAPPVEDGMTSGRVKRTLLHNTYPFNLAGFPALSVPCGLSPEGLPVGLQIAGRPYHEHTVLRAGRAYQEATAWHVTHPSPGSAAGGS